MEGSHSFSHSHAHNHNNSNSSSQATVRTGHRVLMPPSGSLSLEQKLELLESRFTQPQEAQSPPAASTGEAVDSPSSSVHSFSFSPSQQLQHSNLPSSSVRSKRRPSLNTSFHAVDRAAAKHLRKVRANSPTFGIISSATTNSNSGLNHSRLTNQSTASNSSAQTLLTSHLQPRVVAESPPVPVTPGLATSPNHTSKNTPKPPAARNILSSTPSNRGGENASSNPTQKKRKSAPKRKQASVQDRSTLATPSTTSLASPESSKRLRSEDSNPRPLPSALTENSRDRSNSAKTPKKQQPPANNHLIHHFFSATTAKRKDSNTSTSTSSSTTNTQTSATDRVDWQAQCLQLQQQLQDKDEQLKAVSNNKTILHTALQTALEKTKKELVSLQDSTKKKLTCTSQVLEELFRWKSSQQAKETRETLAANGARLGRIVYARAGMRALESWEEGYATKDLEQRKQELVERRKTLEARARQPTVTSNTSPLAVVEAKASIQMHISNLKHQEYELAKEEEALNDEKGAHIRALKRVASEDASRFRSRPKLNDRYLLHCLLGKGGFSEVWRGYDLVELREVAVKIHQLDPRWPDSKKENYTKHVSREYEIHRSVRHPRIVSLYDVFEIDNNSFATVLECCKGTDLDTLLKSKRRLPEAQARALLVQVLLGMKYLSEPSGDRQGIIHYDLKPGNILFDENGDAKITDFGLSKIVDAPDPAESMELTSQGAGTYWYLPPECFITTERVRISNKVDVWSIGVIFYQMLYGARPFGEGKSQDKLLSDHTMLNAQQVHFPDRPEVSEAGKSFIRQCLMYDQAFRPTIAQLCENAYVLNPDAI
eukprot:Nitzschia sp. Nitz4//scaffold89_size161592//76585//79225//NITZ4_002380-RA/size161592-snap-gene-0.175-mRNA-1//-1//CDS//3329559622//8168//frame0